MRIARDEAGTGKIDAAVAMFNAVALMTLNPESSNAIPDDYELPVWA